MAATIKQIFKLIIKKTGNMSIKKIILISGILLVANYVKGQNPDTDVYHEQYRPQIHFSPQAHWMNDPNGMVYYKGIYHLFFQYYPNGTTWGPMHWGHAESKDMIHWKQLPIALYPDSLGYIFSGSAVVDSNNTTGFGKNGKIPLVAIFTHHDPKGEKAGTNNFQNESLAYSLDDGTTWIKYSGNPVLKNLGIKDFRDPKVMWYAPEHKWVMTLATHNRVTFFSSPDLKNWVKESEFGKQAGAHGGVWECPDLFPLSLKGKTYWILIGNINPGGPNGGSATQYFVGTFDGNKFTPIDNKIKWLDYGPDEYAGITWSNTGNRKIFLGWMSNWQYAGQVPTEKWRNAMTIPRELGLQDVNSTLYVTSKPVKELTTIEQIPSGIKDSNTAIHLSAQSVFKLDINKINDYYIILSNDDGEQLVLGYNKTDNRYFIDRTKSGKVAFNPEFAKIAHAPRLISTESSNLELVIDASSVELFADSGLTTMTALFFPRKSFNHLIIKGDSVKFYNIKIFSLKSIWENAKRP